MADKMRLYAGDEDVDLEELERALTIVRRKMADPAASLPGFLSNAEVVVNVSASLCILTRFKRKRILRCCSWRRHC